MRNKRTTQTFRASNSGSQEDIFIDALQHLLENVNGMPNGVTHLYIASEKGYPKVVQCLLQAGAAVNQALANGATPLHTASQKGHIEVVNLLLTARADVNQATMNGASPLYVASYAGHVEVVHRLLTARADVDQAMTTATGTTPLIVASKRGHFKVVEVLLTAGADVNQTRNGITPLQLAARNGHEQVVEDLVTSGATFDKLCLGNNCDVDEGCRIDPISHECLNIEEGIEINWGATVPGRYCYNSGGLGRWQDIRNTDPVDRTPGIQIGPVTNLVRRLLGVNKRNGNVNIPTQEPP